MKNSSLFIAALRAAVFSIVVGTWIWIQVSPAVGHIVAKAAKLHTQALFGKSPLGRTAGFHEHHASLAWDKLLEAAIWLDWLALAGALVLTYQLSFWFFAWLEKRALKEQK